MLEAMFYILGMIVMVLALIAFIVVIIATINL